MKIVGDLLATVDFDTAALTGPSGVWAFVTSVEHRGPNRRTLHFDISQPGTYNTLWLGMDDSYVSAVFLGAGAHVSIPFELTEVT